jgi:quinoprotein glucose dehydrogenase
VRAFDVRTAALRGTFHAIPHPGEAGSETWESGTRLSGASNVWSTATADPERALVFLPVSTPSPDFGPALATASGLVFHGGTRGPVLRVHDADTGERLAAFPPPAGLHAGPSPTSFARADGSSSWWRRAATSSCDRRSATT